MEAFRCASLRIRDSVSSSEGKSILKNVHIVIIMRLNPFDFFWSFREGISKLLVLRNTGCIIINNTRVICNTFIKPIFLHFSMRKKRVVLQGCNTSNTTI